MIRELNLPWPPSLNRYYRHVGSRVLISREGRQYRQQILKRLANEHNTYTTLLEIELDFYPPDNRRRDVDNLAKCLLDALTHAKVYEDDSLIVKLSLTKHPATENGRVHIRIRPYDSTELS